MLNITIQSVDNTILTFTAFKDYNIPAPSGGADVEGDNYLVLKFEDEEDAISYAEQLENLSNQLNDKNTPQYQAINDIIISIRNDEFVQDYSR
ncbi:MAG: hypothetical protein V4577_02485 [Bacteroidota bacterium]